MPNTSSSNRIPKVVPSKNLNLRMRGKMKYSVLQSKLIKLRAVLAHETMISHLIPREPELFPDPSDQAAADHELDVARSVKMRSLDKLRQIEHVLTSMHKHSYRICRRCGLGIPYARLKVQPDTLYCVPCLTRMEQGVSRSYADSDGSVAVDGDQEADHPSDSGSMRRRSMRCSVRAVPA